MSSNEIQRQQRRVLALQTAVYQQSDPSANPALLEQLGEAQRQLQALEAAPAPVAAPNPPSPAAPQTESASAAEPPGGARRSGGPAPVAEPPSGPRRSAHLLGDKTTGLIVTTTVHMHPIPTGVYHLLDPEKDPLLSVVIRNNDRNLNARRVCVKVYIEGLSARAVRTVEIAAKQQVEMKLLPTLLPLQAKAIQEVQRATLHVVVEDLDGKPECHDTYPVICLARTSSFNSVRRPDTGEIVDLTHYYGAWVTPHAELVQRRVRRAAELWPGGSIWGYQGDMDAVTNQVKALFLSLKEAGIIYINSIIDFGAPAGQTTQRTRLPRESLKTKSANCIDGAVLMASLLEAASLNPAIVLVPGHAFVGWQAWDGEDEWHYLETTMIGTHDFEAAMQSGERQIIELKKFGADRLRVHALADLRARGIWPME